MKKDGECISKGQLDLFALSQMHWFVAGLTTVTHS